MSMSEWAKNEVEIACKRENPDRKEEDGHSGFSISLTKQILNRLIDGKPLTPIEDTDDIWEYIWEYDAIKHYQCKLMSSLFKDVYPDGTIRYTDNNEEFMKRKEMDSMKDDKNESGSYKL